MQHAFSSAQREINMASQRMVFPFPEQPQLCVSSQYDMNSSRPKPTGSFFQTGIKTHSHGNWAAASEASVVMSSKHRKAVKSLKTDSRNYCSVLSPPSSQMNKILQSGM